MTTVPRVVLETAGRGVAELAIRIPPVNVLGSADLREIARLLRDAPGHRVLVLTGLPRAFSAGVEVAEHEPEAAAIETMLGAMRAALSALLRTPAVTIASVSGACLGGGAEIACVCDLVLVAEDARIGFPEIRLACFPPGAAAFLPSRVGQARAAEWILTGASYSGQEAAAAGFATRAVPSSSLASETNRLARSLAGRAAPALAAARDLMRVTRLSALEQDLPRAEEAYRSLAGDAELARAVKEWKAGASPRIRR
jgi:cyclohexa-1,5-dienecarbonyl-CoA hydratase